MNKNTIALGLLAVGGAGLYSSLLTNNQGVPPPADYNNTDEVPPAPAENASSSIWGEYLLAIINSFDDLPPELFEEGGALHGIFETYEDVEDYVNQQLGLDLGGFDWTTILDFFKGL